MIRKTSVLCSLVFSAFVSVAAAAAPPVIAPGRWELTMTTILPDSTPTTVTEICITKQRAEHPEPRASKPTDDCQVTGGLNGNRLKYAVKCGRAKTTTDAEFTYSGDRYEGVVIVKTGDYEIRQVHTARRIGECDQ